MSFKQTSFTAPLRSLACNDSSAAAGRHRLRPDRGGRPAADCSALLGARGLAPNSPSHGWHLAARAAYARSSNMRRSANRSGRFATLVPLRCSTPPTGRSRRRPAAGAAPSCAKRPCTTAGGPRGRRHPAGAISVATRSAAPGSARASALRRLTRRGCLNAASEARAVSSAARPRREHRSGVGAQRRPPRHEPRLGAACRDARSLRESGHPRTAASGRKRTSARVSPAWMGVGRGIERHKRVRHFSIRLVELNRHANPA